MNDLAATLVRPLTKVTIAEKNADMFAKCNSMTAAYTVPSEFNAFDETVGATTYNTTYNAAPVGGADITIKGQACKILFSDYVFTATDGTMGGIELTFTGTETLKNKSIPANIPLKRNNWVRAAGNLITADASGYDPNLTMTVDMTTDWVNQDIPDIDGARVGDYYYEDGTWSSTYTNNPSNPCIGIVYEVNADGRSGKIVGLTQINSIDEKPWSTENIVTGATNTTDGRVNMTTIAELITNSGGSKSWDTYPAFKWVTEQNNNTGNWDATTDKWYLPAKDELSAFYTAYDTYGKDNFNAKITTAGGTVFYNSFFYPSSTESSNTQYYHTRFDNGSTGTQNKINNNVVRCIRTF